MSAPLVHVVVVDHDGGDLTLACLRSILASEWPAARLRVVLVDNASRVPVTDAVTRELPDVRVVHSPTNLGFAGGANLGVRARGDADFVAVVNNDAVVDPGWLPPLVESLRADPSVGAACPKILLGGTAVEVAIVATTHRRGRGDPRDLGVRVSGARVDGRDAWPRVQFVDGFWGPEPSPAGEPVSLWTAARAILRVPVTDHQEIELRLAANAPGLVTLTSGTRTTPATVGPDPSWHSVASDAVPVTVINNVGTVIAPDGYAHDRGWLEVDRGQYDTPVDVPAWCGAAVLLARAYLDDVGLFDEQFFLYYEDVDLSLRGARRGWRYRTAPESVVRHVHAATSVDGSALKDYYNERNRLLVATRYAGRGVEHGPLRVVPRYLAVTASYARRDIVAPLLRGDRPRPTVVRRRLHALGAYAAALPRALRARRLDRSSPPSHAAPQDPVTRTAAAPGQPRLAPGPADSGKSAARTRTRSLRPNSPYSPRRR